MDMSRSVPASVQSSVTVDAPSIIQPIGVKALYGLTLVDDYLLAVDPFRGYLLRIDPETGNTQILNSPRGRIFLREQPGWPTGRARSGWLRDHEVLVTGLDDIQLMPVLTLPYPANGLAVWDKTLYVSCKKAGYIFVFDRDSGQRITQFPAPGISIENLSVWGDYLWVCDQVEQSVYGLDRATGEVQVKMLTPFTTPTGLAVPPELTPRWRCPVGGLH